MRASSMKSLASCANSKHAGFIHGTSTKFMFATMKPPFSSKRTIKHRFESRRVCCSLNHRCGLARCQQQEQEEDGAGEGCSASRVHSSSPLDRPHLLPMLAYSRSSPSPGIRHSENGCARAARCFWRVNSCCVLCGLNKLIISRRLNNNSSVVVLCVTLLVNKP